MKKFNILLTSSGFNDINNFVSDEIKNLFKEISKNKLVMILSNAAPLGTGNYIARENVKENFLKVGAKQVDIIDINNDNISNMLNYDIIYGLGGDPFYLIELNKNKDFRKTLIQFLKRGIYIGESSGSMIMCDDLKWVYIIKKGTKPKYDKDLYTYEGLNLTDYKIFPHWNKTKPEIKDKVKTFENETKTKITKLNDGEFITINFKN